ncbi:MAG: HAMP domain-containing histidine kinase [Chloroflexi bacterium]|nr:HAMP domain-containing histidine kinase [Chloroflexota bacterium]
MRMPNPLRTLRGRLATTYAGVALLAVAVSAWFSISAMQQAVEDRARSAVVDDAKLAADAVAAPLDNHDLPAITAYMALVTRDVGARVAVVDRDGQLVAASYASPTLTSADPRLRSAIAGNTIVSQDDGDGGQGIDVVVPVDRGAGPPVGALRASASLQDAGQQTSRVTATALLGALLAAALAALVGLLLAGSIARPIQSVSHAAVDLAERRVVEPVPEPRGSTREVRNLVLGFNSLADQLRVQEVARREFAFDVSHELHSLASAMRTATDALSSGAAADASFGQRLVAGLAGHTRRLSRLADDLLELARWEGGRLEVTPVDMDLGDLARGLLDEWAPEASRREMTLEAHIPSGSLPLRGDPVRLAQAIGNLLENALKYGGAGSRVLLEVTGPGQRGMYDVSVSDAGPGVPPEQLPYIFERHVRAGTAADRTAPDGMGLGLPIAREIVVAHRGTLDASSEPGNGARFTIHLPAPR